MVNHPLNVKDIVEHIFTNLAAQEMFGISRVCKSWRDASNISKTHKQQEELELFVWDCKEGYFCGDNFHHVGTYPFCDKLPRVSFNNLCALATSIQFGNQFAGCAHPLSTNLFPDTTSVELCYQIDEKLVPFVQSMLDSRKICAISLYGPDRLEYITNQFRFSHVEVLQHDFRDGDDLSLFNNVKALNVCCRFPKYFVGKLKVVGIYGFPYFGGELIFEDPSLFEGVKVLFILFWVPTHQKVVDRVRDKVCTFLEETNIEKFILVGCDRDTSDTFQFLIPSGIEFKRRKRFKL